MPPDSGLGSYLVVLLQYHRMCIMESMNAIKKPFSILGRDEDIEIYNTGSDRLRAKNIAKNEKYYHVSLAKEILEEIKNIRHSSLVHLSIPLGQMPNYPTEDSDRWLIDVYEEMLKDVEHKKIIQNLIVKSKEYVYDVGFPEEIITADFDTYPSKLEIYLNEFIKNNKDIEQVISLADSNPIYSKKDAAIKIGDLICLLGHDKNQNSFCERMFSVQCNTQVEAEDLWQVIKGEEISKNGKVNKNIKSLIDTMYRINKKISELCSTEENLFTCNAGGKLFYRRF